MTFDEDKNVSNINEDNIDNNITSEKDNVSNDTNNNKDNNNNLNDNSNNTIRYEYRYRDKKQVISYGNWSKWSTKKIEGNENRQVEEREI